MSAELMKLNAGARETASRLRPTTAVRALWADGVTAQR